MNFDAEIVRLADALRSAETPAKAVEARRALVRHLTRRPPVAALAMHALAQCVFLEEALKTGSLDARVAVYAADTIRNVRAAAAEHDVWR